MQEAESPAPAVLATTASTKLQLSPIKVWQTNVLKSHFLLNPVSHCSRCEVCILPRWGEGGYLKLR